MALTLNAGSGGADLATDVIAAEHYQIIKPSFGGIGTATLVTASVGLPVDVKASIALDVSAATVTVDNAGTFAVQVDGDALTALQLIDNIVLAEDAAHGSGDPGVQMLAVRKSTPVDLSGADGDYEPLQLDNGRLWTSTVVTGTVTVDGSGVTQPISGTVTANLSATDNAVLDDIAASSHVLGTAVYAETVTSGMLAGAVRNDTLAALVDTDNDVGPLQVNAAGALYVEVATQATGPVTNAGTFVVQEDGAALASLQLIDNAISGSEMQVDVVAALPAGTNAIGKLAANDAVDIGDVTINNASNDPVFVAPRSDDDAVAFQFADINDASSGDNTIIAAAGASKHIAVWSVFMVSDGTVDARWEDGAAGTAITGQVPLQAREGYSHSAGGLVPLWVGSANTLLNLELSAAVNVHGSLAYSVLDT